MNKFKDYPYNLPDDTYTVIGHYPTIIQAMLERLRDLEEIVSKLEQSVKALDERTRELIE